MIPGCRHDSPGQDPIRSGSPWLIIPSVSIGVGLPMRVSPETQAGTRVRLDARLGPVACSPPSITTWMSADPRRFEVSMMAQLSL
jgi:hypothetical protein